MSSSTYKQCPAECAPSYPLEEFMRFNSVDSLCIAKNPNNNAQSNKYLIRDYDPYKTHDALLGLGLNVLPQWTNLGIFDPATYGDTDNIWTAKVVNSDDWQAGCFTGTPPVVISPPPPQEDPVSHVPVDCPCPESNNSNMICCIVLGAIGLYFIYNVSQ